jgi:hypothetical protein
MLVVCERAYTNASSSVHLPAGCTSLLTPARSYRNSCTKLAFLFAHILARIAGDTLAQGLSPAAFRALDDVRRMLAYMSTKA